MALVKDQTVSRGASGHWLHNTSL